MTPGQRMCPNPDCGNPYPFDDEQATGPLPPPGAPAGDAPSRSARAARGGGRGGGAGGGGGALAALAPHRTILVLVGVLILIVLVGFLLFRFGMSFFEAGRPDPSTLPTSTAGPVVVPSVPSAASPVTLPSPSPGAGTVIAPGPSPSPAASGVRMKVANTEGQGANMRQRPSTTAPVLRTLPDGTVVEVIGNEQNAEGRNWRNVRDPGGATGWIASELLAPE
jgi:hypothetical protein